MENEKKVTYFLGANSGSGFYPLTDWLIDFHQARRVLLLKGGPGCGKSAFMKEVGRIAEQSGQRVVYFCSCSDVDALDALALPDKRCIIFDATPPHAGAALKYKVTFYEKTPGKVSKYSLTR